MYQRERESKKKVTLLATVLYKDLKFDKHNKLNCLINESVSITNESVFFIYRAVSINLHF